MSNNFEKIGANRIYLDETYFIAYAGGKRDLPAKDMKEYQKAMNMPFLIQRKELKKIPFEKNPNVVPLKGRHLISFIKELNFIPMFDKFFDQSRLLKLTDLVIFESIKSKSYDLALKG